MIFQLIATLPEYHLMAYLCDRWIPNHIKRALVLGSVYGLFAKDRCTDFVELEKINLKLKIARKPRVLNPGIWFSRRIWRSLFTSAPLIIGGVRIDFETFHPDQLTAYPNPLHAVQQLSHFLATRSPEWLRYTSETLISKDIECLLRILYVH